MWARMKRVLRSDRGEANYFSAVFYIFIAVAVLAFILNLFSIISTKQQLDHTADQMVKQVQLAGEVDSDTEDLFDYLCSEIKGATNIRYDIETDFKTGRRIQLGTPFYVTITGKAKLGGMWDFNYFNITIVARGAGVSERYWK